MTFQTFVFIPGAGGMASYWYRVVPLLKDLGHEAIAVDLPGDDETSGLATYADLVVAAIGDRRVVLVAQSLGGFTAPLVMSRVPVERLVLVNAMIPLPGETAGAWWGNTGAKQARIDLAKQAGYSPEFDPMTYFFHDLPAAVLREIDKEKVRQEAGIVFGEPCEFAAWPNVPIQVIAGRDDRFFPIEFQRRVARERLGLESEEISGGHLVALSNPEELVERLVR